jgi:hypothetical protein
MKGLYKSEIAGCIYIAIIIVVMVCWFIDVLVEELK